MLYRVEIENFGSIRDPQVLDLRVPRSVPDHPERFPAIFPGSEDRVARVIALLGPNGSGKSIALRALAFVSWFLRESFQHQGPGLPCERFNDEESANRPIRLAIELGGRLDPCGSVGDAEDVAATEYVGTFRYELHLQPEHGLVRTVAHEALRMRRKGQGKWQRVLERGGDRSVRGSRSFPLAGFAQVIDKIREDASVVATLALFEHRASKAISDAAGAVFPNILIDRPDPGDQAVMQHFAQSPNMLAALNRELRRIDVGVEEMRIVQAAAGPVAQLKHRGLDAEMPWDLESHGTRSFVRVFPHILRALERGGIAIVDELDRSIHPRVLAEIVRWFYDRERNPSDAQLWMSCQSASLLDDLIKEEVVLCEKDGDGRCQIYSLMDVGAVRRADNLYKKYLGGVYGAVPQVG